MNNFLSKLKEMSGGTAGRTLLLLVAALVLLGGGYALGRYASPTKVVVTEKVREVVKEVVVEKVKTEVQVVKVYVKSEAKKVHKVTEEKPDGTKITTEDENVDSVVKENTDTHSVEVKFVDRIVEKLVEKEKLVLKETRVPDWRVGAGVGISIPAFLGGPQIGVPGMEGSVVSLDLARRLFGRERSMWLGVMGSTQGTLGLTLSGEF